MEEQPVNEMRRRRKASIGGVALAFVLLIGFSQAAAPAPEALPTEELGSRVAVTAPGIPSVNLYFEEQGTGDTILLLHGLGESTFTWHDVIPALAARHRVIALDLKGFGRSDKPDDGFYSADDQAALVARFIIERDLKDVTLIGHSFGGTVALRTALGEGMKGSGRIRRIAVIGSPALPRSTARYLDLVKTPVLPDTLASALSPEALARLLLREASGGYVDSDENVEGYAAPYRDQAAMRSFFATARAIVTETDANEIAKRYKALEQPVLVVWCRKDPIVPLSAGRKLAATLPRARLAIIEGCHHLPQHERPKQLLKTLSAFIAR